MLSQLFKSFLSNRDEKCCWNTNWKVHIKIGFQQLEMGLDRELPAFCSSTHELNRIEWLKMYHFKFNFKWLAFVGGKFKCTVYDIVLVSISILHTHTISTKNIWISKIEISTIILTFDMLNETPMQFIDVSKHISENNSKRTCVCFITNLTQFIH